MNRRLLGAVVLMAAAQMLFACNGTNQASSDLDAAQKAQARAAVDVVRDCNKPWYDTVSASDHTTIIKGMTPIEREVCAQFLHTGGNPGR